MNSRGTLISQRISGETLASNDRVAMTPTDQPAAAGIQRYREFDRPRERGAERRSVTDGEDMPPPAHPAAAGIQRYREFDRPRERGAERRSVTDGEDMPSTREMPYEARESPVPITCAPPAFSRRPESCVRAAGQ